MGAMVAWTMFAIVLTVARGSVHDYSAYLDQWNVVLSGGDPWDGSLPARNAYGPVHSIFAPLLVVDPLVPKLIMVGSFLTVNLMIVMRVARTDVSFRQRVLYVVFIPLNGCVLVWGIAYGDNDVLVAALVGLALLARIDNRMSWTGFLLGVAVLLKFYPAVLIVYFAMDRRRISFTLLVASGVTILAGLAIAFAIWGGNSLSWLLFASERGASLHSIWNAVASDSNSDWIQRWIDIAVRFNLILLAVFSIAWLLFVWRVRMEWLPAAIGGLLGVLLLYKVGHGQFYLAWLILACGLLLVRGAGYTKLSFACLPAAIAASVVGFAYDAQREFSLLTMITDEMLGWFSFLMGAITITMIALFRSDSQIPADMRAHTDRVEPGVG